MAFGLRLDDARNDLINLAAIDGKNGANGRHTPTNLNRVLNRKYRNLRSRVSQLGLPQFLVPGASTPVPAATVGEDYIEIPMPAESSEIVGIDLFGVGTGNGWGKLDPIDFGQRRDINPFFVNPGFRFGTVANQGLVPPNGVGFWCVNKAPNADQAAAITAGTIALFPKTLTGSYKLHCVESWTDITTDSHLFLLYEAWDEWFLNAAVMSICQRDKNKADIYIQARDAWQAADDLIVESAQRLQRGGFYDPTPYNSVNL